MTWHNKVIWTEGMFLQPQHFQQHDRFIARQAHARFGLLAGCGWGFASLEIDSSALSLGRLAITGASGVMPDGLVFDLPGQDVAPPACEVPADARDELLVLAAVLQRPGVAESDAETGGTAIGNTAALPPRYRVTEVEVGDSNANGERPALIQVGRLELRLMLARDARDGHATLGLARIVERRTDNRLVLDKRFVPPTLQVDGNALLAGYLREVHGLLHQRGEALAQRLAQPGRAGIGEIADFLLLQAINRNEPSFEQLQQASVLHPQDLYLRCVALAGELSTFGDQRRPARLPAYRHDDAAACFRPLMDDLRQSLSMVLEQTAIPIELQDRKYGVRVALIHDVELLRNAQFVLAVNAQMPAETLRARFPTQVKIGTVERIRDLVNLQLPGVALRPLALAPRQIPYHSGLQYFELETAGNPLWKQLEAAGGLALHIAGDFPGLEIEFWAVRT